MSNVITKVITSNRATQESSSQRRDATVSEWRKLEDALLRAFKFEERSKSQTLQMAWGIWKSQKKKKKKFFLRIA